MVMYKIMPKKKSKPTEGYSDKLELRIEQQIAELGELQEVDRLLRGHLAESGQQLRRRAAAQADDLGLAVDRNMLDAGKVAGMDHEGPNLITWENFMVGLGFIALIAIIVLIVFVLRGSRDNEDEEKDEKEDEIEGF